MITKMGKYCTIMLIGLIFLAPGIGAYFFYQNPTWLSTSKVNKGILFQKPLHLALSPDKKWKLLFWSPKGCDESCLQTLDKLARIRLALGRKLYYVRQVLLLDRDLTELTLRLRPLLKDASIDIENLSLQESTALKSLGTQLHVFLANPEGYIILGYPKDVKPDDVYKDLKLLLNKSDS